jgi:HAD superfamily hydrolase (TIGR01549 family)
MIDTVTFDLWNTLIVNLPLDVEKYRTRRLEGIQRILRERGYHISSAQLLEAYLKGFEKCKETWRRNLDLSTEEQITNLMGFLGFSDFQNKAENLMSDLAEAYSSPILDDPPELIVGAKEILTDLSRERYKIGLICNTGTTPGSALRTLLTGFGLLDLFRVATFSDELKIRKPDPRIFQQTLRRLNSTPQNSLHVGDLLSVDVVGAKNVGMLAVQVDSGQPFFDEILPQCDGEIQPDYSIGELKELKLILEHLNLD